MPESTTYPEWIAALNAEALRRGGSDTQPPYAMNPFVDAFPLSPHDDD
jgi:hypothetical protein